MAQVDNRTQYAADVASTANARRRRRSDDFHLPELARQGSMHLLAAQERFDLVFVHCSSVAPYVSSTSAAPPPRSSTSATWTRRSGSNMRATSRFRCHLGYRLEGSQDGTWAEKRLARCFSICARRRRGAEWETLQSYGTGVASDWFPEWSRQPSTSAPSGEPY